MCLAEDEMPEFNITKQHLCVSSNVQEYGKEEARRHTAQETHSFERV